MATTIDHLAAGQAVRVVRDFTDANGMERHAGEVGTILEISVDWRSHSVLIRWNRAGRDETLAFPLARVNGRMREWFAVEQEPAGQPIDTARARARATIDASTVDGPVRVVLDLALTERFDDAMAALRRCTDEPDSLAEALERAAACAAHRGNAVALDWLRERAIDHWHAWGSQATSGGDGAARMLSIGPALRRLKGLGIVDP